jgi:hypothetical protein
MRHQPGIQGPVPPPGTMKRVGSRVIIRSARAVHMMMVT